MAILNFCGFETGDFSEARSTVGTVAVTAGTARTGGYGFGQNISFSGNINNYSIYGKHSSLGPQGALGLTTGYYTFYFKIESFTSLTPTVYIFFVADIGATNSVCAFQIDGSRNLTITGATTSSTIATLSVGIWYRLEMKVISNGTCEGRVDGGTAQTCTGNNLTQDWAAVGLSTGMFSGGTFSFSWDDLVISDSGYVGAGQVDVLKPTANATSYTAWTQNTSDTKANSIANIPPSNSFYISSGNAAGDQRYAAELENVPSVGGQIGTIGSVKAVGLFIEAAASVSSGSIGLNSGSTLVESTGIDVGTTYVTLGYLTNTDPATSAAWTTSGLNALQLVVRRLAAATADIQVEDAYVMVWHTVIPGMLFPKISRVAVRRAAYW